MLRNSEKQERQLRRSAADLAAVKIAIGATVGGLILMFLAGWLAEPPPRGASAFETVVKEAGALLFVGGLLTVLWELKGRRAMTSEVLMAARVSVEISEAGLKRITGSYLSQVEWVEYFSRSKRADLFFAYAETWRNLNADALRDFALRRGTRLRVVLPDPANEQLIERLSDKFSYEPDRLVEKIRAAADYFESLRAQASSDSEVEVRYTREFPVFTFYGFDSECVIVKYAQARERTPSVPTLVCSNSGFLGGFYVGQFDWLWTEARHAVAQPADGQQRDVSAMG